MKRMFCLCSFVFSLVAAQAKTPPLNLQQILEQVEKANRRIKTISAEIDYTRKIPLIGSKDVRHGTLKFKKPRLVRLHFLKPEEQLQIVGEKEVWIYTPAEKQVEHYKVSRKATRGVGFLDFGFGQSVSETQRNYKIELLSTIEKNNKRFYRLKLTPKRDDLNVPYSKILIDLEEGQWVPVVISLFESEDNIETTIKLKNVRVNPFFGVSNRDFRFKPPSGTQLIEM